MAPTQNPACQQFVLSTALIASIWSVANAGVLFDFDNAPVHTSLPIGLSAGGVTATLSATGQGYSIQPANTLGFTPVGFSGLCVYPNSVFKADLVIDFSKPLTDFSILFAVQDLECDQPSTMKVSAYAGATLVGSALKSPGEGTWPTATLSFSSPISFNHVVVHYEKVPPISCDYGVIFMADNMEVTLAPTAAEDLNGDGSVDGADLGLLLSAWGSNQPEADLNGDGTVDGADLGLLLGAWGS